MTDILQAIYNIIKFKNFNINNYALGRNRINNMGGSLENFIKDAFAGTLNESDEQTRLKIFQEKFSWLGAQNNPPDIMIRGGDAIEVKKIQSANSQIALNSSYPKDKLTKNNPMLTRACRDCEAWQEKDLIYCIGHTTDRKLLSLWMVYGSLYAADANTYQNIKGIIEAGITEIPNITFSKTKELGRINQVDPLGITNLRIRGMWEIANPRRVFEYIHKSESSAFELVCLIPKDKYDTFSIESKNNIISLQDKYFTIQNCKIKSPNNPAVLIDCVVLKYIVN